MQVIRAEKYGFCFGVKRAIKITEKIAKKNKNTLTLGPLIHNPLEINRLESDFGVKVQEDINNLGDSKSVIIRTHGITKQNLDELKTRDIAITDATCPFVTKPQKIVEQMSNEGYRIVIFGDSKHPEVRSVMSYSVTPPIVVGDLDSIKSLEKVPKKIAIVSQTTKQIEKFLEIVSYLVSNSLEVRVFNTICNATFENQEATRELSKKADIMIIVGGKTSSNTKQLFFISKNHCPDSYLVENENDIESSWFKGKKICGITAGASTPNWVIKNVEDKIKNL
ncbi:4-hydroxy-3-methylbut-2-enyl diphosphate reductase [Helicobacter saguini]|uniref:4-hydroxy-3-methylbut-2-enyl diphosphate reductase n=1 Tax=Helicobacter saguini TaxID=1548018 RepID=A0A347VS93_9HELI|nr:4-hydroxy-3-methylbut-2-enyl diphosphate reductase [Helicobacter saguini]MWV62602.1 4-hydroxy-3-methylbut-2-enyl diphosphate reductase [Helicobacter saguini]MWV66726.1 4-hydroxy-3-methylbut-2-enyl diphosphate reductase [Helicobacter saguini]MWV69076.1 4-hydroxy-3-methylbut-2-enyl diphosphate reductase [Helicobacter saguini]MWV71370.1 4-hydroxy-3-methylbut-2-enyl diphosphate reductase [Helicobacter saguini]TLD94004.1 4-hydroxy-3-methylbut-2-enyl diphosphate reductase [Helicobacter saguini]